VGKAASGRLESWRGTKPDLLVGSLVSKKKKKWGMGGIKEAYPARC